MEVGGGAMMSTNRAPTGRVFKMQMVVCKIAMTMSTNRGPTGRVFKKRIFAAQNCHGNVHKPRPDGAALHSPGQSRHEVAASPWVSRAGQVAPGKVECSKCEYFWCKISTAISANRAPNGAAPHSPGQSRRKAAATPWVPHAGQVAPCKGSYII